MSRRESGASRPELNKSAWQKLRKQARLRDGNRCVRCRSTKNLAAHHIVKPQNGGRDVLENLATLCSRCHGLQHRGPRHGGYRAETPTATPRSPVGNPSPMAPRGKDLSPDYEDDPENGIFWGPKQPNGMMTRWSRPWFDWRADPEYSEVR